MRRETGKISAKNLESVFFIVNLRGNYKNMHNTLRQHQWKAFLRNPMFERELGIKIFMFFCFGILALEFLSFGFFLDKLLQEKGSYERPIDSFNALILYVFVLDFALKFFFKGDRSIQIAPYLTLPLKRDRLFDFLLRKEFTSFWNLYFLFLFVPFAFKAVAPFFSFGTALLHILFFYLLCIMNSLFVNLVNSLAKRSAWFYILAAGIVSFPFVFLLVLKIDLGDYTRQAGEWLQENNLFLWAGLIFLFVILWMVNRKQMRGELYRELQGEKIEKTASFSSFSFLERLGGPGVFINLELQMITRAKRLKSQFFSLAFLIVFFFWQIYSSDIQSNPFTLLFFGIFTIASLGIIMGQYLFLTESSFFDGLMSRKLSIYNLLKGKYIFYSSVSVLVSLLMLIPVVSGKLSLLTVVSLLFFVTGPIYFLIFQNAVYNKMYFDLFDGGMMNWRGSSSNMMIITMISMFVPVLVVLPLQLFFGRETGEWFMLITGLAFTFAAPYWLNGIYHRFLKRKYKNMEGFRSL
jgi:hypothetical protein